MAALSTTQRKSDKIEFKPWTPAHEKIGTFFSRTVEALKGGDQESAKDLFKELGVFPEDIEAVQAMSALILQIDSKNLEFFPTDNSGAYYLKLGSKNIAVFKIGRKRASMEIMARFLARELGLQRHMVPGMFWTAFDPDFDPEKETFEELWNGNHKIYLDQVDPEDDLIQFAPSIGGFEETACAVVGIVQPFLSEQPKASLLDFTMMTMFALAIGLRDGKEDSFKGSTIFDVEDCMPVRLDPPVWAPKLINKYPAALELSFLDTDKRAQQELTLEDVGTLAALVQKWNIATILQNIHRLKIKYEDTVAEQMEVETIGSDEGGCAVKIQEPEVPHLINGYLNHLSDENPKKRILLPRQLDACITRLQRIHDFILKCAREEETFTPQQLVHAVDPWGKIYTDKLIQKSPELPGKLASMVRTTGYNTVTGRRSPEDVKFPIDFEDADQHEAAVSIRKSQGVPEKDATPRPSPQED